MDDAIRFIAQSHPAFPARLREIAKIPDGIYVRGGAPVEMLGRDMIAIVGTRRATPDGNRIAEHFGRELARAGLGIVSGLALGIDAAAHEGAVEARGFSVAVLANGVDRIYPNTNARLGERILQSGGMIISEYPPGEPVYKYRFLERNRIVSGLARGVLIVEAPESSGSLATASFALEQNRDVFVVPGSISHPNFRGANQLIRQGAELVTKPEDILEAYNLERRPKHAAENYRGSSEETLILQALAKAGRPPDVDKISLMTKLEPRIVNRAITFLILNRAVIESEGGYILETSF